MLHLGGRLGNCLLRAALKLRYNTHSTDKAVALGVRKAPRQRKYLAASARNRAFLLEAARFQTARLASRFFNKPDGL